MNITVKLILEVR